MFERLVNLYMAMRDKQQRDSDNRYEAMLPSILQGHKDWQSNYDSRASQHMDAG